MTSDLSVPQRRALAAAAGPEGIRRACFTDLARTRPVACYHTVDSLVRRGFLHRVGDTGVFVPVRDNPGMPETAP